MPELPGQFQDGQILFAGPLELIRDMLENSLAFKATGPNQILASTGAGNMSGDNTKLLTFPTTGQGVFRLNSDGTITVEQLDLIDGVQASNTDLIPFSRLPLKSWTQNTAGNIPASALPGASGFALTPLFNHTNLTVSFSGNAVVTNCWRQLGYQLPTTITDDEVLAISFAPANRVSPTVDLGGAAASGIHFITARDLLRHVDSNGANARDHGGQLIIDFQRANASSQAMYFATDSSRNVLIYRDGLGHTGNIAFTRFDLWRVTNVTVTGEIRPATVTPTEADAGIVTELRSWSPALVRRAAAQITVDAVARASATQAQAEVDAAEVRITALEASSGLAASDLPSHVEDFALEAQATATVPTSRLTDDSVTETKLAPQVRTKINGLASALPAIPAAAAADKNYNLRVAMDGTVSWVEV